jgi:hypothetical protein
MRRVTVLLVLAIAVAAALVVAPSQTRSAEATPVSYGVSMNGACTQQYGWGAQSHYWNLWDAYSWFCWRVTGGSGTVTLAQKGGISASGTLNFVILGGVNQIDQWCKRTYPGTFSVVQNRYWAYSWACWRY